MARERKTRRVRVAEKERAIVAAAHEVLMEHGLEGARMSEIARRASVAEGTIYIYFENKSALVRAVMKAFYEGLTEGASEIIAGATDPAQRIELLALHHMERCLADWRIIELSAGGFRNAEGEAAEELLHLNRSYVSVFDGVFKEAVAQGVFRADLGLATARDLFYGGLEYACRTAILRGHRAGSREAAAAARAMARAVLEGAIGASPPAPEPSRLEQVTERLEQVAERLTKAASKSRRGS